MQTDAEQVTILLRVVGGVLANNVASVSLYRPKSLTGFKLYATSAKIIVVVPCN